MPASVLLVVNPSAGAGRAARELGPVQATLERLGVPHRVERTRSLAHAEELARGGAADGETVLTLGGDGLVGAVAGALRGSGALLGVLPGGRGNDFVRVLGLPTDDAAAACAGVLAGVPREVDVAEVVPEGAAQGRSYVGIASYGLDSDVQVVANATRWVKGDLVYLYATLRALASWRHARFEVELEEPAAEGGWVWRRRALEGYSVAVANSGVFGGGMRLAPDARLDDGLLDVVLSERSSKARFLASIPKVFRGTHLAEPSVHLVRARAARLRADRPFDIYADGDPIAPLPATIRLHHRALRVLAPA